MAQEGQGVLGAVRDRGTAMRGGLPLSSRPFSPHGNPIGTKVMGTQESRKSQKPKQSDESPDSAGCSHELAQSAEEKALPA